ncbi:hypothetical protein Cob_v004474 [Colletotrichum orbiculare MAFF 240422]|uniref:Ubiquitin interaction domain-containing protein n=1 Tax=Colletotrichum orbiculare (strain 104-T / ATCC 96160 / CBS 514.97 / LARS 414 / MAFF 240422) TaxID=1213857 RepID=A0A484FXA3_COLOR|nr:hypothetical protein Cob_v004474 [Colletotrichum orbiculare MAFF 240422]
MAREPTPADIAQFCEFTGLDVDRDRTLVVSALKSGQEMEPLLMEYFDNPDSFRSKHTWDDSAFGADRDGAGNNAGIAFNIDASDDAVIQGVTPPPDSYYGASAGAPSRPPSRANNRSPMGRMMDWTAGTASAPSNAAQEEEDLQRALRESAVESGFKPQVAGVTDPSTTAQHFGPANRPDYDQNSWAMVPTAAGTSQPTSSDIPRAYLRKREEGAPAFLVQQPNARNSEHRLGSILTILHNIPAARNLLLSTGEPAASYGHNSEWWKGQPIYPPHVLAAMQQGERSGEDENDAKPNFHEEIHRLMAFLDHTERSYGSVETFADSVPRTELNLERQFYDTLNSSTHPDIMQPMTHVALSTYVGGSGEGSEISRFACLNFELTDSQYRQTKSLYEAWDWLFWNEALLWQEVTPNTRMVVLKDMGDILTMALDGDGPPESMDVPEVFYPERYLHSRKGEATVIQEHLAWVHKGLYQAESSEYEYTKWVHPKTNKVYDKRELLEKTIKEFESHARYLDGLGRFRELEKSEDEEKQYIRLEDVACVLSETEEGLRQNSEQVVERCKWLLADIEQKMDKLKWERERLHERQRFLSTLLTDPNKPGLENPFSGKAYSLRGISTRRDVTYTCRRQQPDLIVLGEAPATVDQWWRLSYEAGDAQPAKAERVSIELVMRSIFLETKNPILVYATEDALNATPLPLTDSLQRFVLAENKNFRQELSQDSTDKSSSYGAALSMLPELPDERKQRSGSVDSMDTNRASMGASDVDSRFGGLSESVANFLADNSFGGGHGTRDTEMMGFPSIREAFQLPNSSTAPAVYPSDTQETAWGHDTKSPIPRADLHPGSPLANGATDVSRTVTPDAEEQPKGPEMQERSGSGANSPFMARHFATANDSKSEEHGIKVTTMDIPDEC